MMTDRPTVAEVSDLVSVYYGLDGNIVGGGLHIVLDDGNIADDHVRWSLKRARERHDRPTVILAGLLLLQTKSQRGRVYRTRRGFPPACTVADFDAIAGPLLAKYPAACPDCSGKRTVECAHCQEGYGDLVRASRPCLCGGGPGPHGERPCSVCGGSGVEEWAEPGVCDWCGGHWHWPCPTCGVILARISHIHLSL